MFNLPPYLRPPPPEEQPTDEKYELDWEKIQTVDDLKTVIRAVMPWQTLYFRPNARDYERVKHLLKREVSDD